MKAKMIFTWMVGMIDSTWGAGTVDSVIKQVLDGKSNEEIMDKIGPPRWMKEQKEREEDCPVCHGAGATTDHHDPCTECGGSGKVGG